jgi:hypothetical protein
MLGWGSNSVGSVGDGTLTERQSPIPISVLSDVTQISSGVASLALKADGTAWTWGYNGFGAIGDGTTANRPTPRQIAGLRDASAVCAGRYTSLVAGLLNTRPEATAQTASADEDVPLTVTLTGTDGDSDAVIYRITGLPTHGMLYQGTGIGGTPIPAVPFALTGAVVTYLGNAEYTGSDSFQFAAYDGAIESSASATVSLTVVPVNDAPTVSSPGNQSVASGTATSALPFTVADVDSPTAGLILSGASNATTLLPNANIVFGGSDANRTVTLTPAAGQSGTATVTVTVSDGSASSFTTCTLTVAPGPPVLSNVIATDLALTGARITWTTDRASTSVVEWGTTTALLSTPVTGPANVTSHSVTLSGLTAGMSYYYRVRSVTTGGSAPTAETVSSTLAMRTAPSIPGQVLGYTMTREGSVIRLSVTVFNNTAAPLANVRFTRASLQVSTTLTNTTTPVPVSLGAIPAGGSASTVLTFPAGLGTAGAAAVMSCGWSTSAGSASSSARVTLP